MIHLLCKHLIILCRIIEKNKGTRLAAEILIDEWGTSGRIRPNLAHLLQLLVKAELFRAADYVACDLLNGESCTIFGRKMKDLKWESFTEPLPQRPEKGPAAKIDITLPPDEEIAEVGAMLTGMEYPNSSGINNMQSQMENNRDFYDKWIPNDQRKLQLVNSTNAVSVNLMEFSQSTVSGTQEANLSLHSDVVGNDGIVLVGDGIRSNSTNIPSSIGTLSTDIPDDMTSSRNDTEIPLVLNEDLPNVSLLRVNRDDPPQEAQDSIPRFSLLMARGDDVHVQSEESILDSTSSVESSHYSQSSQSTNEIISNASIPNLSILQGK